MIERLEATLAKYNELEQELTKPEVLSDIKKTREDIEKSLGESVISKNNALSYKYLDSNKLDKKKLQKGKSRENK